MERRRLGAASLLSRIALVGAATVVALAIGSPAWANSTIDINPGNVADGGTTAADFDNHECNANQGGGPYATQDVWVFNLPNQGATSLGEFISITAHFEGQADQEINTTDDPGNFNTGDPGTSKAWILTPAGWKLTGAEAVISDPSDVATEQTFFVLTHTCPADPQATTPPPPTTTPPVRTTDPGTPSGGVNSGGGGSQSNAGLVWGVTALVVAAAGGGVLFLAWRRRNSA
ncbi:MAG: hypothetical protein ACM30G_12520 [Micromonosporaceae bacterium]